LVERDDRSTVGTFFAGAPLTSGTTAILGEQAAHHARVKRLSVGDRVALTDGMGRRAVGEIADIRRASMDVAVSEVESVERPPAIHLRVPVADRDRMLWLAEKATELGVTTWQAVRFQRSMSVSPRGEGASFHEKLRARMLSALEQSGGAWLPEQLPDTTVHDLCFRADVQAIVLDASGAPLASIVRDGGSSKVPVLLVGPEGGIVAEERVALVANGWQPATLGKTTLRFETAGIAGIAVIRAAQLLNGS
jgi:16S rRNA (uracil1498-N3)-methyltransferase